MIGTVASSTSITLASSAGGTPVNATATDPEANLTINPLPLDLTGITFTCEARKTVADPQAWITATTPTTMLNGGTSGQLSFNVPKASLVSVQPGPYVMDIVASGDGHTVNLFQKTGPASLTVTQGVTR